MIVGECLWKLLEASAVIDSKRHVWHLKLKRRPCNFERLFNVLGVQTHSVHYRIIPHAPCLKGGETEVDKRNSSQGSQKKLLIL